MAVDEHDTERRIRQKAHQVWESEGRPHGRHESHWAQAREMVAIEDAHETALKPIPEGDAAPVEPRLALDNQAEMPGLTDQGDHIPVPSLQTAVDHADDRAVSPPSSPPSGRAGDRAKASRAAAAPPAGLKRSDAETVKADARGQFAPARTIRDNDGLSAAKPVAFTGDGDATRPSRPRRSAEKPKGTESLTVSGDRNK